MTRTSLAVNELKNNIPYIVVITNPTTGGVTAYGNAGRYNFS